MGMNLLVKIGGHELMKRLIAQVTLAVALTLPLTACNHLWAAATGSADSAADTSKMSWEELARAAGVAKLTDPEKAASLYGQALDKATAADAPPKKQLTLLYNLAELLSDHSFCKDADALYVRGLKLARDNKFTDWEAALIVRQSINDRPLVEQGVKKSLDPAPVLAALELRPGEPDVPTEFRGLAYLALGRAYQWSKKYDMAEKNFLLAREQFKAVGALDERVRHASENLLNCYVSEGKFREANKLYVEVGKSEPAYRWNYLNIYRAHLAVNTFDNWGIEDKTEKLVTARDFDGLDAYAAELHKAKQPFASGDWPMDKMIKQLECNDGAKEAFVEKRFAFLKDWLAKNPKSKTARIALGVNYAAWAWRARGSGYADTVSENGWKLFGERLEEAKKVLAAVDDRPGEFYWVWQRVAMGLDLDDTETVAEGLKKYPAYTKIVSAKFYRLQPRWGGEDGADMRFLNEQVAANPGDAGDMLYERVALNSAWLFTNLFGDGHFDKERVMRGAAAIRKAMPESQVARAVSIYMAMEANDMPTAEALADGTKK
jgi:hypothetical protein